jgi:L-rhamnono-1,4-lactonase
VKLSGGFSELPKNTTRSKAVEYLLPWFKVFLDLWGPSKIIFGSDWPVCKFGGGTEAINHWIEIVKDLTTECGLSEREQDAIFYLNAHTAYKLDA